MFFRKEKEPKRNRPSNIAMMDKKVKESYMEDEIRKIRKKDLEDVLDNEEEIAHKLNKAKPLRKFAEISKVMFQMLWDIQSGKYKRTPWFSIAAIVFIFLYVLNPFDLIPDFVPGLGYLDDFTIFAMGLGWIETDLHHYLDWRIRQAELKELEEFLEEEEDDYYF